MAAAVVTTAACSSDDTPGASASIVDAKEGASEATTFVAELATTRGFLALTVVDDDVKGYYCEKEGASSDGLVSYLTGTRSGDSIAAADDLDGATLDAEFVGDPDESSFQGTIVLSDGSRHEFVATEAGGSAGLFALVDPAGDEVGVWIRLADGRVRGDALAVGADGVPTAPPSLGGSSVPPEANPQKLFAGLRCFLATRRYLRAVETATTPDEIAEMNDLNSARVSACHTNV